MPVAQAFELIRNLPAVLAGRVVVPGDLRAAYPGNTWGRLRAVKAKYDPDNFFRLNENISLS